MNPPPQTPPPQTLKAAVTQVTARLTRAGIDNARLEARVLIGAALGGDSALTLTQGEAPLDVSDWYQIEMMTMRREGREPVAQILGEKEFWSLNFRVNSATLIPRPDTETLVEAVLADVADKSAPLRILDLGTGSGCILLALLSELPQATGLGVDHAEGALAVALDNAHRLGFMDRVAFQSSNWCDGVDGRFDLVVSNPPYIPDADLEGLEPEVRTFEPHSALAGGADGLDAYRSLAAGMATVLAPGARIALECGVDQSQSVIGIFAEAGFTRSEIKADLAGIERCVSFRAP